ncbi:hypothetical protein C2S53_008798 [Perilla frutescens var. hirtella]|uniref:Zinc finger-XS domain-containing protein n=1 Tax=Perilla frutescens var. hirtella TaxID=608512 RepID=A0AAD4NZG4_PERFH|nr:hypothetical protein C2S53_008798 [Perilla frutescens var. hirtella]
MSSRINLKKENMSLDKDFDHLNDSLMNEYKELSYKYLQFRTYRLRGSNGDFGCPFCDHKEEHQNNQYKHLLFHAIQVSESSESGKQRANHLAMAKYIVIDLADDVKAEDSSKGEMDTAHRVRQLERELNEKTDEMNDLITKER